MSRISHRRQVRPHGSDALLMAATISSFNVFRSCPTRHQTLSVAGMAASWLHGNTHALQKGEHADLEDLVQFEFPELGPHGCLRQLRNRKLGLLNAIRCLERVINLDIAAEAHVSEVPRQQSAAPRRETYRTPSMCMVTLSCVMAAWDGISITISLSVCTYLEVTRYQPPTSSPPRGKVPYLISSINGMRSESPGSRTL